MVQDHLLHLGLAARRLLAHLLGDEAERDVVGGARVLGRFQVHRPLLVVPARLEQLDQIARRHDLDAERSHQLDRAGIDARDIGIGVARHVFHGHPLGALHRAPHAGFEFLPAQIDSLRAGHMIERRRLDAVDQLARLALAGMK